MAYILGKVEAVGIVIPKTFHHFNYWEMVNEIRPNLPRLKHIFVVGGSVPEGAISVREMVEQPIDENYAPNDLEKTRFRALEYPWVQLTTGSTGFPKFVEAPTCSTIHCAKEIAEGCKLGRDDVCGLFASAPAGPNMLGNHSAPLAGAKIAMLERFDAGEALKFIEKEKITIIGIVPTMLAKMMDDPGFDNYDLSSLRVVLVTGAPLLPKLAMEAEEKIGLVAQHYGAVDYGGITAPYIDASREVRLYSVGRLFSGTQVKIVNDQGVEVPSGEAGELNVKGPGCISGFYMDPEATWQTWTKDGWFRTGDLARLDDEGNLSIVGRKKEVIIRGGQNILPAEIENLLIDHPKVANVVIVGMPDAVMGEKACACVVSKEEARLSFDEMVNFLREKNIAAYKLPERLEIVDQLPLVPGSQKVDKKVLEREIAEKLKAEGETE
jgi:non-ribosomal peptide synthetase component E (peptide arylation enzyme)